MTITKTSSPKEKLPKEKLVFGRTFTDHMLTIKYHKDSGWDAPAIVPYGNLSLSPASNSLHYAIEVRGACCSSDTGAASYLTKLDLDLDLDLDLELDSASRA